ncbi:MAG: glycoside hydrolase family 15 protein [Sporichthyaceae bacterium]|nr:glycoside hydrolase family 15 protein [Sporichthyaceae bacterium]
MPSRIEAYALIGDTHTAALVGRNGSIDWFCLPRFDSGAVFAALLGDESHGAWSLAPEGQTATPRRRYREDTLVLETEFTTATGRVRVIDFMPHRHEHPTLVRIVEGLDGAVDMRLRLRLRFDYGWVVPWVRHTEQGIHAIAGPDAVCLQTPVELVGRDMATEAEFTVRRGERIPFLLAWHRSADPVPGRFDAEAALTRCTDTWREWASRCSYDGPWRSAVARSLITLKALTYDPSGAIVAAATTSLPEQLGGPRNWDYRYSWLRDATFSLLALMSSGYLEEAREWRSWLLRAVAGDPAQLQIMYGLDGERRLTEIELDWLPGFAGSRPVRIGNDAARQLQLDVYGEVMDALHQARRAGLGVDEDAWELQRALVEYLEGRWREPDDGLWEVRSGRQHFTHSKVMAWVAFDRAALAVQRHRLPGNAARWRERADTVHAQVCREAYDPQRGAFMQAYGSSALDASALLLPLVGFLPPDDVRVRGTVDAIRRELCSDGLVQRYRTDSAGADGLSGGEGAFLLCSFWLVDNLALRGDTDEAGEMLERLLGLRNDVGLLAEEYDPVGGMQLGNFPQAFSHVGLINSAHALASPRGPAQCRARRAPGR